MIVLILAWTRPVLCLAGDTVRFPVDSCLKAFNEFDEFNITLIQRREGVVPTSAQPGLYNLISKHQGQYDTLAQALVVYPFWADTLRFIQLSDPHLGYNPKTDSNYALAVQLVNCLNPDLVIITGDIAEKGQSAQGPAQYADFLRISRGLRVPWFVIPGNHDYYDRWWRNRGLRNYRAFISPDTDYTFNYGQLALFIMVNTGPDAVFWDWASLCRGFTRGQLRWIRDQLSHTQARIRFIATHGPVIDPDEKDESVKNGVRQMLDMMRLYRVDAVLSGHTHENRCYGPDARPFADTKQRPLPRPLHIQTTTCAKGPDQKLGFSYFEADTGGLIQTPIRLGLHDIVLDQRFSRDSSRCAVFIINKTNTSFGSCALWLKMAPGRDYMLVGNAKMVRQSGSGLCQLQIPKLEPGITVISVVPR